GPLSFGGECPVWRGGCIRSRSFVRSQLWGRAQKGLVQQIPVWRRKIGFGWRDLFLGRSGSFRRTAGLVVLWNGWVTIRRQRIGCPVGGSVVRSYLLHGETG